MWTKCNGACKKLCFPKQMCMCRPNQHLGFLNLCHISSNVKCFISTRIKLILYLWYMKPLFPWTGVAKMKSLILWFSLYHVQNVFLPRSPHIKSCSISLFTLQVNLNMSYQLCWFYRTNKRLAITRESKCPFGWFDRGNQCWEFIVKKNSLISPWMDGTLLPLTLCGNIFRGRNNVMIKIDSGSVQGNKAFVCLDGL